MNYDLASTSLQRVISAKISGIDFLEHMLFQLGYNQIKKCLLLKQNEVKRGNKFKQ